MLGNGTGSWKLRLRALPLQGVLFYWYQGVRTLEPCRFVVLNPYFICSVGHRWSRLEWIGVDWN